MEKLPENFYSRNICNYLNYIFNEYTWSANKRQYFI